MRNEFEKIPECVWQLMDNIMWASAIAEGRDPDAKFNRGNAEMIAWGWNPPLMHKGTDRLTMHGLAAYAWRDEQQPTPKEEKRKNAPKNVNKIMAEKVLSEDKECLGWTCTEWARYCGCTPAAVVKTKTWERLRESREIIKAERAMDRHRKPKHVKQDDD